MARPPALERRVLYREAHTLINDLADAALDHTRKQQMELFPTVPLLIIDDLRMHKLPATAAEDLLEIVMRRYERASTVLTSNGPIDDWGQTSWRHGRRHHYARLASPSRSRSEVRPRSWRTKTQLPGG